MSALSWTPDAPVAGQEGDPDFGACRVCQYHDAATGSLMYRIEKEATTPADEAELICIHVSAAYCRRLLAAMKADMGGELGAKGAMLLIRGATQASDGEHTGQIREGRAGHPDALRPTGTTRRVVRTGPARHAQGMRSHRHEEGSDSTGELPF